MLLGFISCRDHAEADSIGMKLLRKHLVSCIQILDSVQSSYLWPPGKSTVDYAEESILLVKTVETKWASLEREVKRQHSYKNPEILALPVSHVSTSYLNWINEELK